MQDIREKLIDLLTGYSLDTYEDVQYVADELIAKGVVPAVRCKDCKHWSDDAIGDECQCMYWKGLFDYCKPTDFCSYGERKDGGG